MLILRKVVFHRCPDGEAFALGDGREVFRDRFKHLFVDFGFVTERESIFSDVEQRRIRGIIGQRRQGGVDRSNPQLHSFKTTEWTKTRRAMCVELDRNAVGIVENDRHQSLHSFRRQQSSGIFQAEAVGLQRCRLTRSLGEIFIAVLRRH